SLAGPVLSAFDPITNSFKASPPPRGCPTGSGVQGKNPWASAKSRDGVLWTHYLEWDDATSKYTYDRVFTIDTKSSACTDTGKDLRLGSAKAIEYGFAFLPHPSDPSQDQLFATALTPPGFDNAELVRIG